MSQDHPAALPLQRLLEPRAIALVGASPDARKLAGRPLAYLHRYGYRGAVHPVNPRHAQIDGTACTPTVQELPDGVDLALLLLPAPGVPDALQACGERGIPYAISIAGGFAEAGDAAAQARLAAICRDTGIRLIGPNCVGLLNPRASVTATFSTELRHAMPRPGRLALVTQSGALGNALLQAINAYGLGLGAWVSTGNEADLGLLDLVEHFIADPQIDLIGLFVEGLKEGERLLPLARRAQAAGKTIVALRAGRSQLGRQASISHTGKLAGAWRVWRDVAAQGGLIEVESLDALLDVAIAFDRCGDPRRDVAAGLGVLTISGGLGVLISDHAADHELPVPTFTDATRAALREVLPPQMGVANPVDTALFTDERGYATCADAVLRDPGVGVLLIVLTRLAHDYEALVPWLVDLSREAQARGRHVAVTCLSSVDQPEPSQRRRLLEAGVLVLPTPERVVAALGRRARAGRWLGQAPVQPLPALAPAADAGDLLSHAQLPTVPQAVFTDADAACRFAAEVGFPVVLKVESPDIAHKTEVGGVRLGLADEAALRAAWSGMQRDLAAHAPQARLTGLSVQPQIDDGAELIVGLSRDPEIGPVLMVGAGGIWAEIFDDVRFLGLPLARSEVEQALQGLRIGAVLRGARGRPALDTDAAVEIVCRLAQAYHGDARIAEVDVNPLIVRPAPKGAVAVDTLLVPAGTHSDPKESSLS